MDREGWFKSTPRLPSCDTESDSPGFPCFLWPEFFLKNFSRKLLFHNPSFCNGNSLVLGNQESQLQGMQKIANFVFLSKKKNQFSYLSFFQYNWTFKVGISEQRSRWNIDCWSVVMLAIISLSSSVPRSRLEGGGD